MKRFSYFIFVTCLITKSLCHANPCCPSSYPPKQNPCCRNEADVQDEKLGVSMMLWGISIGVAVTIFTGLVHNSGTVKSAPTSN